MASPAPKPTPDRLPVRADVEADARAEKREEAVGLDLPITVLGHDDGVYFFLSAEGQFRSFHYKNLTESGISSLFGGVTDKLLDLWPVFAKSRRGQPTEVIGWNVGDARRVLIDAAHRAGLYNPERHLRGPGVWRCLAPTYEQKIDAETTARRPASAPTDPRGYCLTVHCGDRVLAPGPAGLTWWKSGHRIGEYHYTAAPRETPPAAKPATADQCQDIHELLHCWNWGQPAHAPRLYFGWIGAAAIAGALDWRPHVHILAENAAGKTWLLDFGEQLLGDACIGVSNPTEAGIRQLLGMAARPVFVDEIEPDDVRKVQQVITLARLASTDKQGKVPRGSKEGKASLFPVRASFCLSSIGAIAYEPQDLQRICVLELMRLPEDRPMPGETDYEAPGTRVGREIARLGQLGPALRRRMIDGWERFHENLRRFELATMRAGKTARVADQIATLLAAAETLLSDDPVDDAEADKLIADFAIPDLTGHEDERGHMQCVTHILTSQVACMGEGGGTFYKLVGDLIQETEGRPRSPANDRLRRHGLAVIRSRHDGLLYLSIANRHAGLERLFRDTQWSQQRWRVHCGRVDGARTNEVQDYSGAKLRSTLMPLAALPLVGPVTGKEPYDPDAPDGSGEA